MYHPIDWAPPREVRRLLDDALWSIPSPIDASYIVQSLRVPAIFSGIPVQARYVGLLPSQQIVAHQDAPIKGVRYHLPLQINDDCWVYHKGVWQKLMLGMIYQMDPTEPHGAVNWGTELRIHLMVDYRVEQRP